MHLDCGMAGQSSEPKWDEAVLHAKNGPKQGGGIAVVGFSAHQIKFPHCPHCARKGLKLDALKSVRRQRANKWVRKWWKTFLSFKFLRAQSVRGVC